MKSKTLAVALLIVVAAALLSGCGTKAPSISSLVPAQGAPGAVFKVSGTDFGTAKGSVRLGSTEADTSQWGATQITAKVPDGLQAGAYEVTVQAGSATSPGIQFKVTAPSKTTTPSTTAPQSSKTTTPGTTAPQSQESQQQAIKDYYSSHGWSMQEPGGTQKLVELFKTSTSDPTWELWYVPQGQGVDVGVYLLHMVTGKGWTVVANGAGTSDAGTTPNLNPQSYGAPADLTWTGWPPAN